MQCAMQLLLGPDQALNTQTVEPALMPPVSAPVQSLWQPAPLLQYESVRGASLPDSAAAPDRARAHPSAAAPAGSINAGKQQAAG